MEFRIADRAALLSHPRLAKSAVCLQLPLVPLAVDHILPRRPGRRQVIRVDYRGVLHHDGTSCSLRRRGSRDRHQSCGRKGQAQCSRDDHNPRPPTLHVTRSIATPAAAEMIRESRHNAVRPNLCRVQWHLCRQAAVGPRLVASRYLVSVPGRCRSPSCRHPISSRPGPGGRSHFGCWSGRRRCKVARLEPCQLYLIQLIGDTITLQVRKAARVMRRHLAV